MDSQQSTRCTVALRSLRFISESGATVYTLGIRVLGDRGPLSKSRRRSHSRCCLEDEQRIVFVCVPEHKTLRISWFARILHMDEEIRVPPELKSKKARRRSSAVPLGEDDFALGCSQRNTHARSTRRQRALR
jgi:hypothetical protein